MDRTITQGLYKHKHMIRIFSAENRRQLGGATRLTLLV